MKKIKIITIILAIILITLVAFGGVYIKTQNRMENKVKDYDFARELHGGRFVQLQVISDSAEHDHDGDGKNDHEVEITSKENLTEENYEIVKKTLETRLKNFGAQDYTISLNKENGNIIVELPEDNNTDTYVYLLTESVKVQINEKDAKTELLSDSMVEKTTYTYTADMEGAYQVTLEVHLTAEGQAKIEEIKNNYAILADEVAEIEAAQEAAKKEAENKKEENSEEKTEEKNTTEETKKIAVLTIAGTEYDIDKIEKNKMIVKIGGKTTNTSTINNNISAAAQLSVLINSGKYPINYEIQENRFVYTDITDMQIIYIASAFAIAMFIVFIGLIIKYRTKGLLVSISCIGFTSILLLVLRYTNVNISIEGIGAIILTIIINIRINQLMIEGNVDYKNIVLKLAPIVIIALVFCFARWTNLSSFGMIMFWGFVLIAAYNAIITKTLLKLKESK